jgi:putative flavoprotein involved in K+ transport
MERERFDTVVIGGGQAGLAAGAHLRRARRSFVILEGHGRIGDGWRERYDSLRLFTPAHAVGLPGDRYRSRGAMPPTKDEIADYFERYAARQALPVRTNVWVRSLRREEDAYVIEASDATYEAANVIVATGAHREPRVPALADRLDRSVLQLHSSEYRNPSQIRDGGVLVVGAGNSGGDIAFELSRSHDVWLSGPDVGHVPVDIDGWFGRHIASRVVVFLGRHVATQRTPIGRRAKAKVLGGGHPLVRVKPGRLVEAGVHRVGKTVDVRDGAPVLEDGSMPVVANVIWCTGFRHDLSWIELPIFDDDGRPRHERGVVTNEPGLYFVGLPFQFSYSSDLIPGVGRDAAYVVRHLSKRANVRGTMQPVA